MYYLNPSELALVIGPSLTACLFPLLCPTLPCLKPLFLYGFYGRSRKFFPPRPIPLVLLLKPRELVRRNACSSSIAYPLQHLYMYMRFTQSISFKLINQHTSGSTHRLPAVLTPRFGTHLPHTLPFLPLPFFRWDVCPRNVHGAAIDAERDDVGHLLPPSSRVEVMLVARVLARVKVHPAVLRWGIVLVTRE